MRQGKRSSHTLRDAVRTAPMVAPPATAFPVPFPDGPIELAAVGVATACTCTVNWPLVLAIWLGTGLVTGVVTYIRERRREKAVDERLLEELKGFGVENTL